MERANHFLRAFVEVARAGSMTGAALALHFSTPTISRAVAALEQELGVELIVRGAGSSRTPAGDQVLPLACAVLCAWAHMAGDTSATPGGSACVAGATLPCAGLPGRCRGQTLTHSRENDAAERRAEVGGPGPPP